MEDAQCPQCYISDDECHLCGLLVHHSQVPWILLNGAILCADCSPIFEDWGETDIVQTNMSDL